MPLTNGSAGRCRHTAARSSVSSTARAGHGVSYSDWQLRFIAHLFDHGIDGRRGGASCGHCGAQCREREGDRGEGEHGGDVEDGEDGEMREYASSDPAVVMCRAGAGALATGVRCACTVALIRRDVC